MPALSVEAEAFGAAALLPGFAHRKFRSSGADIHYAIGGNGPPLLLLHGNPLTHVSWHRVAPRLAERFTVVAPDLRGYGDSSKPDGGDDHRAYSFREMGRDNLELMASLGFERFQLAGHDRGARVAFRMALDAPSAISRLAALDIVPTYELLSDVTMGWALESYHWFFMAQKAPFPERLIGADLGYYIDYKLNKKGVGLSIFDPRAFAEYKRCTTHEQIHAVCEDYRATVGIDYAMDEADKQAGARIDCPVLVLWGANSHVGRHLKPLESWRRWAGDVTGEAIDTGHYPAEQRPDLVLAAFERFFDAGGN